MSNNFNSFSKIIQKKSNGIELKNNEINFVVKNYLADEISDEQMASFLKTVINKGLSKNETYYLTKAMQQSGETLDLSELYPVADKHSSGGVSDSTTLLIVPILASLGVKILKMSGKGLGFTGGTADKVLCFQGLNNNLSIEQAINITKQTNGCFITQSENLAPADKKIYELRDKNGLIESIPLIASSIISKKLASGSDIILLDVKFGSGAFMKNLNEATELANLMIDILKQESKKACAVITSMEEPLGDFVGDELEVFESISILMGNKKNNLLKLSEYLSALILSMAKNINLNEAKKQVRETIESKKALEKLKQIVKVQGGSLNIFDEEFKSFKVNLKAENSGYIQKINTENIGFLTRKHKGTFNNFLGIEIKARTGRKVSENSNLAILHFKDNANLINVKDIEKDYKRCFEISNIKSIKQFKLIEKIIK
ncbi:MAG: thymidine phosphorylase [Clostridia bacterium]|nr:thymidine phosphorylase [Clostridia bacterium]MDD4685752.1 thymidine phosphorylase [Clostridia bacterium]